VIAFNAVLASINACDKAAKYCGISFLTYEELTCEKGTHKNTPLYGNCIVNIPTVDADGKLKKSYSIYAGMAQRCFDHKHAARFPTYAECTLAREWRMYRNFDRWFAKFYIPGYHLDKDILVPGNKIYGPRYCRFVPPNINQLFLEKGKVQNGLPRGITYDKSRNKIAADFFGDGKRIRLGRFDVDDVDSALAAYKEVKAAHIVAMAKRYRADVCLEIYEALIYRAENGLF
jgi:hypothetical protein